MPKTTNKSKSEFKAGIFIILSIALLIFTVLWIRYFAVKPSMNIIAAFKNPGPIARGLPVYFQGVNVGKVDKVRFSDDFKYTLVYIEIYYEGLKLPSNSTARVESQGITGQKYLEIAYPANPSQVYLTNNATIYGEQAFGIAELQRMLGEQIKSGRLQKIINEFEESFLLQKQLSIKLEQTADNINKVLLSNKDKINIIFKEGAASSQKLKLVLNNLNEVVGDPAVKRDFKDLVASTSSVGRNVSNLLGDNTLRETILRNSENVGRLINNTNNLLEGLQTTAGRTPGLASNLNTLLADLDELVNNLNLYSEEVYDQLNRTGTICNLNNSILKAGRAFDEAGNFFGSSNTALSSISRSQTGKNIGVLFTETLQNTNQAAKRFDCFNRNLSTMLNKRFLLLRLLFGKPGSSLEECEKMDKKENPNKTP